MGTTGGVEDTTLGGLGGENGEKERAEGGLKAKAGAVGVA